MEKLIKEIERLKNSAYALQKEIEGDGWSPWSMHQWSYLEGQITALSTILLYYCDMLGPCTAGSEEAK